MNALRPLLACLVVGVASTFLASCGTEPASVRTSAFESHRKLSPSQQKIRDGADAKFRAGRLALSAGKLTEAESLLQQSLAIDPGHLSAVRFLAEAYDRDGKYDEAFRMYQLLLRNTESRSTAQNNPEVLARYGGVAMQVQDKAEARWAFSSALECGRDTVGADYPKNSGSSDDLRDLRSQAYIAASIEAWSHGDELGSQEWAYRAVESSPRREISRFYYGYFMARSTPSRLDEAIKIFERLESSRNASIQGAARNLLAELRQAKASS